MLGSRSPSTTPGRNGSDAPRGHGRQGGIFDASRHEACRACRGGLTAAFAPAVAGGKQSGNGNGKGDAAVITGSFSDECRDFEGHSTKDISNVKISYADGRFKEINVNKPDVFIDGGEGDEIDYLVVKSGQTSKRFDCDDGGGPKPECSDGVDNADPEDTKADEQDPGCLSGPGGSYDPNDPSEVDEGGGAARCRASVLRIEGNAVLGELGLDPFEPFVANDPYDPCATDDGSLINAEESPISLEIVAAETDGAGSPAAHAAVANVGIEGVLTATALYSEASCDAGGPSSSSTVVGLVVLGNPVVIPPDDAHIHVDVPGVGTLHVNHEEQTGNDVTRRALYLDMLAPLGDLTGDVIIAESRAGC